MFPRDKLGKLALSPKQRTIFSHWVRPDEICNNPTMILSVSSFSIKQVRPHTQLSIFNINNQDQNVPKCTL